MQQREQRLSDLIKNEQRVTRVFLQVPGQLEQIALCRFLLDRFAAAEQTSTKVAAREGHCVQRSCIQPRGPDSVLVGSFVNQ